MQIINKLLCESCGSNCDLRTVVYGKIQVIFCKECVDKKQETTFKFSELSTPAKHNAF